MTVSRLRDADPAARARAAGAPLGAVLGEGETRVLLTAGGGGCSWHGAHALTRFSGDAVEDHEGFFLYLRDADDGTWWSATRRPSPRTPQREHVSADAGRVSFELEQHGIASVLEVTLVADAHAELRRLTLRNLGSAPRRIEVTTYAEVVLHHPAADASHPAFSKLFVQTEARPESGTLLAHRRPRGHDESHPWLVHVLTGKGAAEVETDRVRFIGRGRDVTAPRALCERAPLSGTAGDVLDPIVAVRRVVELAPGAEASLTAVLATAASRDAALVLAARFSAGAGVTEAFAAAETRERARRVALGVSDAQAVRLQSLACALLLGDPRLRADAAVLARAGEARHALAKLCVPNGSALAIVRADLVGGFEQLEAAILAHRYLRDLGVPLTMLVLCDDPERLPASALLHERADELLLRPVSSIAPEALEALLAEARWVVAGPLPELLGPEDSTLPLPAPLTGPAATCDASEPLREVGPYGGFRTDGREYVLRLAYAPETGLQRPPLPWTNVIANEHFGTLVSETGAACTWSRNSREHRLTPWLNDPLVDPHGEALFVRDETSGAFWSPTCAPATAPAALEVRHGFGRTTWHMTYAQLEHTCAVFVAREARVKCLEVTLANHAPHARALSLTHYARLVLGVAPDGAGRRVVTQHDAAGALLLAHNAAAGEFANAVTFAAAVHEGRAERSVSADRAAFIGSAGRLAVAEALREPGALDGRVGAGLDACFAERLAFTLAPGEQRTFTFLLGEADDAAAAAALVASLRMPGALARTQRDVETFWEHLADGVTIETPSPELDHMVNGWLAYQTLSCRIWGRTAYYQSGGAFGFRDQLQDAASLLHTDPARTRAQIVLHAAHQFVEGDVLHWWHPPLSKGIRTRFADDLLWLPYLTATYVQMTGDASVLDERAGFLEARLLREGEDEVFLEPQRSRESASVYEHCMRAIERSLVTGAHGLPLFGTGDWNDGMNRVGREGRGESVWMGFFLVTILDAVAPWCEARGESDRAVRYRAHRDALLRSLDDAGWDGEWYRRAYYDDGTPLGTKGASECRIDGLAQAWAVISGAASPERAASAMDALERELVDEPNGIIRLLTPAFRDTPNDPGYIKGYVAGVRENGGQYTHAALWVVRAMARMGRRDRAARWLAMLSPVHHTRTAADVERYQCEPYVIAADIYGEAPHVGRGGWTWYTGSAGWMLRVAIEDILGLQREGGDAMRVRPCIPDTWPGFTMRVRLGDGGGTLHIVATNPTGCSACVTAATLDGAAMRIEGGEVRIADLRDGRDHELRFTLGASRS